MPGTGDALTVISAMRHANPKAVAMILSAFPEMDAASHAVMLARRSGTASQFKAASWDAIHVFEASHFRETNGLDETASPIVLAEQSRLANSL
jgi:hypothetical protein